MLREIRFWLARKILPVLGEVKNQPTMEDDVKAYEFDKEAYLKGRFNTFSGVDTKVYFDLHNEETVCVPEVQAVKWSVNHQRENEVYGTIKTIVFDQDALAHLPAPVKNIRLKAANEYGAIAEIVFSDVILQHSSSGISIKDYVCEMETSFHAYTSQPWTSLRKITV